MKKGCWQPQLPSIRHPLEGPGRMISVQNSINVLPRPQFTIYLPQFFSANSSWGNPTCPNGTWEKASVTRQKHVKRRGEWWWWWLLLHGFGCVEKNCWTMSKMINLNDSSKERWNLKWILHLNETLIFWKKDLQFSWGSARSYRILMWKR